MSLMVSISGIRGIVGETLTPEVVVSYVSAYSEYCKNGTIVIGNDGRISGSPLSRIVAGVLQQSGSNVIDLGICPTPTVAYAVEKLQTAGGISITASHNPIMWNGLKFFSPTGLFLDAQENAEFWQIASRGHWQYRTWSHLGSYTTAYDFIEQHIDDILALPLIDISTIRQRKFKVVIDAVNAAGSKCVPSLLTRLGCEIVPIHCEPTGIFAHTPEPLPENIGDLCSEVKQTKADLGIAVDPDVDRLVLITEEGKPFGEEYTIASLIKFILTKRANQQSKKVVVNLSTTRAVDDIAKSLGAEVIRTQVGEINVAKKMKEVGALIGGEGSGGVILPDIHYGRDALVGIALFLQYLAEFGKPVSELKASLPLYYISKNKIETGSVNPDIALKRAIDYYSAKGSINTDDGVKINLPLSWIHLRKSNTEPIIRIIAEAPTMEEAHTLVEECKSILKTK